MFSDDEHDPEGSTASMDQVRDTALLATVRRTLAELLAARERLDAGAYGVCESCGRPIAPERLEARPGARTCVACAARR
ncbi:TraR/DksA family transcriptional regulator [Microlunatus flavus]|uniref:DksA/traR C4-type zinc finger n=1 Tax=Microlunatus flavus TaxID=1036181 RepID=A0A1H8ZTH8_9ACTN|nr:TraR/DksA C4-type zinc finger protein [Microlunatus flavus]SEP67769.1 dksA/traR C4-type zinc finger [Microlunatus flavus]